MVGAVEAGGVVGDRGREIESLQLRSRGFRRGYAMKRERYWRGPEKSSVRNVGISDESDVCLVYKIGRAHV